MRLEVQIEAPDISALHIDFDTSKWSSQINYVDNAALATNDPSRTVVAFQISQLRENPVAILNGKYTILPDGGFPGFISQALSDEDGNFTEENAPYITLKTISDTAAIFVTFTEGYPVKYTLTANGITRTYDNNTSKVISITDKANTQVKLTVYKWHADSTEVKSSSVKIISISAQFNMTYTETNLISIVNSETLFDSQMNIEPGICEQYADVRIYDRDGQLHQLAHAGKLDEDYIVTIYAIDTETHIIGTYRVKDWDIPATSSVIGVICNDMTHTFKNINVPSVPVLTRTVDDMLSMAFDLLNGVDWQYIDSDTQNYCQHIETPDCWFYSSNLLTLLNKICTLGFLRIFWYIDKFIVARCY